MDFQGTAVYEIDGTCYYISTLNNRTVNKFEEGEKRNKVIKKLAYASGAPGAEVTSPEGTGKTAVLTETAEEEKPPEEEKTEAEVSGVHS